MDIFFQNNINPKPWSNGCVSLICYWIQNARGVTQHPQMHHPHFSVLRPSNWMNPNFRTHGIILEPSAMEMLAGKQEPNDKKFPAHAPSVHGRWCICGCCLTLAILFYLLYKTPQNTHVNLLCWASYMCKQGAHHILLNLMDETK
jgi:hypothetical protein